MSALCNKTLTIIGLGMAAAGKSCKIETAMVLMPIMYSLLP